MKNLFLTFICLCVSIVVNAQCYRVVSVERQSSPDMKLLQVLKAQDHLLVYGTITTTKEKNWSCAGRTTAIVKNGMRYKLLNSVNLPFYDDAEPRYLVLLQDETVNFVLEFEDFDLSESFDLRFTEGGNEPDKYDFYGIKLEKIDEKDVIDTQRFLDGVHTIFGRYMDNGKEYRYYIRDDIMFEFKNSWFNNDFLFEIKVVNSSDHGVMVDLDMIHATATDQKDRPKEVVRYTAESYDAHIERDRRTAAYYNTGGSKTSDINRRIDSESRKTNDGWAQIGLGALKALNNQAQENRVQKYLKQHPRTLPKALRSTSLKPGESIYGYIPYKKIKKLKTLSLSISLDGYTYNISYNLN